MKNTPLIRPFAFALVFFCLGLALSGPVGAQEKTDAAPVEKWEYRVVSISESRGQRSDDLKAREKSSQDQLNALGQDGWELVAVRSRSGDPVFYFKRRVR